MNPGERLKLLRKDYLKLTTQELGTSVNVSRSLISSIENSTTVLTNRVANDICDKYHVNYQWLYEGKEETPMFIDKPTPIDVLAIAYNLTDEEKAFVRFYCSDKTTRENITKLIREVASCL